jgi:hypothetical protein
MAVVASQERHINAEINVLNIAKSIMNDDSECPNANHVKYKQTIIDPPKQTHQDLKCLLLEQIFLLLTNLSQYLFISSFSKKVTFVTS